MKKLAGTLYVISEKQQSIKGVFDKDCVSALVAKSLAPKATHSQKLHNHQQRLINQSTHTRMLPLSYIHHPQSFSSFSKHIPRHFDLSLEEHLKVYEEQLQEMSDKISTGEVQEEELARLKERDDLKFG
jgi:hypothetical protein